MVLLLVILGLLIFLAGGLMLLIAAFRVSIWWGLCSIFFMPTLFLFAILNWGKARRAILVQVAGITLIVVALLMMGNFLSSLRDRPFSSTYKQFSWSSSTVSPGTAVPHAPVVHNNSAPEVIDPQAAEGLPVLPEKK
jgi:hypothetical protein